MSSNDSTSHITMTPAEMLSMLGHMATQEHVNTTRVELDGKIEAKTKEVKDEIKTLRTELKGDMQELRVELKGDMQELKTELKGDMQELKTELKGDIQELKTELKGDIQELKTELRASNEFVKKIMLGVFMTVITTCISSCLMLGYHFFIS